MLTTKKTFLLIDLLGYISHLSEDEGLEPVATSTKFLQEIIETNFEEMVSFQIFGKKVDDVLLRRQPTHLCCCHTKRRWASWWWFNMSICKNHTEENLRKQTEMSTISRGVNQKSRYYRTIPTHLKCSCLVINNKRSISKSGFTKFNCAPVERK